MFVLRADIRRLVCTAWLLPTDAMATIEPGWTAPLPPPRTTSTEEWFDALGAAIDRERGRRFAASEWTRVLEPRSPGGAVAVLTRTAMADDHVDPRYVAHAVREFVRTAISVPRQGPAANRAVPLLAVPAVGTGRGGGAAVKGEVLDQLLELLHDVAHDSGVDIAVVTRSAAATAAMRDRRRGAVDAAFKLEPALVEAARGLAARVRRGEVVLFTGAGVGVPAGLPSWENLLRDLDSAALLADEELARLSLLDQAAVIERELDPEGSRGRERLVEGIVRAVDRDHYALGQALLANMPITEAATLNYDRLFEIAAADAGRHIDVLPYERVSPDAVGWLLKLHGCVDPDRRDDIVLTREDYLSLSGHRAVLTGLLQAMLVTRHMLFVGFGLGDEHFHAVVHDVRRALHRRGSSDGPRTLGTALLLHPSAAATRVWSRDLDLLPMGGDDAPRLLEIFLDLLANDSDQGWQHVLDDSYAHILSEDLRKLRALLNGLAAEEPLLSAGGAWPAVHALLRTFGYDKDT